MTNQVSTGKAVPGKLNILGDSDDSDEGFNAGLNEARYEFGEEESRQLMFFFNEEMNTAMKDGDITVDIRPDVPKVIIKAKRLSGGKASEKNYWNVLLHEIKQENLHNEDFDNVKRNISQSGLSARVLALPSREIQKMTRIYAKKNQDLETLKSKMKDTIPLTGREGRFVDSNHDVKNGGARPRTSVKQEQLPGSLKSRGSMISKLEFVTKNCLKVKVYTGPITRLDVDVIVNAANDRLENIGGVAKVIADAAGRDLGRECKNLIRDEGTVADGDNMVTKAGKLHYKAIIHAVGPRWTAYSDKVSCLETLITTVTNILSTAEKFGYRTVAMPPISAGIFGVPKKLCAAMYIHGIMKFSERYERLEKLKEFHIIDIQDEVLDMVAEWYDKWKVIPNCLDCSSILVKEYENSKRNISGRNECFKSNDRKPNFGTDSDMCEVSLKSSTGNTEIRIYTGNIMDLKKTKIDAVVVSDSPTFDGKGGLAKALLNAGGKTYRKQREMIKPNVGSVNEGKVYMCDAGPDLPFARVFHGIIGRLSNDRLDYHLKTIEQIILNTLDLIENTSKKKKVALAFPMIGTGGLTDVSLINSCCQVAEDAIWKGLGKTSAVRQIHLVNQNQEITDILRELFQRHIKRGPAPRRPSIVQKTTGTSNVNQVKGLRKIEAWKFEKQEGSNVDFTEFWKVFGKKNEQKIGNLMIIGDDEDGAEEESSCVICMCESTNPVQLIKCSHVFCRECIIEVFKAKPSCPICSTTYGKIYGDQPRDGIASVYIDPVPLPGYSEDTYVIQYEFPSGKQQEFHSNPGQPYDGITRVGYLPKTTDGTHILELLKKAFEQGLTFTIGNSRTTGKEGVITWNDIHHKTSKTSGPQKFGYPDPEYLGRVREELAAKGLVD